MNSKPEIKISVVIPVYNASQYIEAAIESALSQPQTSEVVVVEDGSPDDSLNVCRRIATKYEKVKLYQHPNGENQGPASSRNLGIKMAHCDYVAFLDADDFFLPNRFEETEKLFLTDPRIDGVYEAIGTKYEDENSKSLFANVGLHELTTVKKKIPPEGLFKAFMRGGAGGYYSIVGFTARKKIFSEVALFDGSLEMYEDAMLMLQLSAKCRLCPGNITSPVAIRRVHSSNRITHRFNDKEKTYKSILDFWKSFFSWSQINLPSYQVNWVAEKVLGHIKTRPMPTPYSKWRFFLSTRKAMLELALEKPDILFMLFYWKYLIPRPWKKIW